MAEAPKGRIEFVMPGDEHSAIRVWMATNSRELRVVRLGPLQSFLVFVGLLTFLWLGVVFMSGVLLIFIPLVIAVVAGAYLVGLLGFHRPH